MSSKKRKGHPTANPLYKLIGFLFLFSALAIALKIYFPVLKSEVVYQSAKVIPSKSEIIPVDRNFSILIPKIKVNTKVIKNVDPFDSKIYQQALTQGVAHAKDSGLPGFPGNTFIFAHSATDWAQANRYNAIFYLTNKLEPGDEIFVYYEGSKYQYTVTEKKIVSGTDINYLSKGLNINSPNTSSLTLMTCWPPGTTLKRLIIIAKSL